MSSCTRRCSFRVAPIDENSSLLPPVGVWAVLNPSVADHPLRPATDRRLGKPLPYQLANQAQAHPLTPLAKLCFLRNVCGIVTDFSVVFLIRGEIPMCYSPVRHSLLAKRVRLACVRHAASVYPEPGSNSPFIVVCQQDLRPAFVQNGLLSCDPGQTAVVVTVAFGCSRKLIRLTAGRVRPL